MKHEIFETNDANAPNCIKDANGDVVLALCKKCGKAEIELEKYPCKGNKS